MQPIPVSRRRVLRLLPFEALAIRFHIQVRGQASQDRWEPLWPKDDFQATPEAE